KWHVEVVAFEDAPQGNKDASNKHKALVRQLQRHYVIYSNHKLGLLRPLNRLVKFANAETVLVVNSGQHASVSPQWVESAVHALHVHPVRQRSLRERLSQDGRRSPGPNWGGLDLVLSALAPWWVPIARPWTWCGWCWDAPHSILMERTARILKA
ncbi:hypothetical protein CYMTET_29994, partial [Cymbomonas tetramitiformis]